jgi:hypothetical protein
VAHVDREPAAAARDAAREIELAWRALGRRSACAAGALTALVALLAHAPVRIAAARGAVAWLAVIAIAAGARIWIASSGRARDGAPRRAP